MCKYCFPYDEHSKLFEIDLSHRVGICGVKQNCPSGLMVFENVSMAVNYNLFYGEVVKFG